MEDNKIKSFVFLESMHRSIEELPDTEAKLEAYQAICNYGLYQKETATNPYIKALMQQNKVVIDSTLKRRKANIENGKKGGRPKTEKNPNETEKKPKKPNHNLNVNVNGNVNVNKHTKEFTEALDEFKTMRKNIKKPLTHQAEQRLIKKLEKLSQDEKTRIAILNQSVDHCWQDVYELKRETETREDIIPVYDSRNNPALNQERLEEILARRKS